VRAIYASINRGDIEAALDAGAPEVEHDWSRSVGPYRGIYRGRDEIRAFWTQFQDAVDDLTFDVEEVIESGPHVIAMVRVRIRGHGSGVEAFARGPHLWTMTKGKVVRFVLFQEKSEALEAIELRE
jgi:ketosteroid isomerase-like protein